MPPGREDYTSKQFQAKQDHGVLAQMTLINEVTRLATQGRNGYSQWVTKYKLQYSDDGVNFQYYWEHGAIKVRFAYLNYTLIN